MRGRDIRLIIQKPVVTEKSTSLKENFNRYVFRVDVKANKRQIKKAVEELFEVKVKDVRTAVIRGKRSVVMNRRGRFEGYRPNWKKAYVTLAEGDNIDIFEVV
ncbi:MAG: 50S ribosomal protein L23 [Candidatus Krumholzibacteria bacterium]|jgi:large subunit ribosomal protein L23|nr:50S ribosomal protein L23 [Candidatus Krumholzibacteria bacterium]